MPTDCNQLLALSIFVLCLKQTPIPASRPAQWQATCFFYLGVWSSLVIRYAVTANSNNTPQQSTPGYKETSKLVPGTSPPTKVSKSENRYIHNINVTIQACYTVSCMSNNLVCGCTIGIDCCHVMSHTICHNPLKFYNYYLVYYIPIV